MIDVLVCANGMILSISRSRSPTERTCALATKQSSPVMRSHSTISGNSAIRAATLRSWPAIGRMRIDAASGEPSAAGSTSMV